MRAASPIATSPLRASLHPVVQDWHDRAYEIADRQLRSLFIVGNLSQGVGWLHDPRTFNYSAAACDANDGCVLDRDFSIPPGDGLLSLTPLSDFTYTGDINATDPPPAGAVPYSIAEELTCEWQRCRRQSLPAIQRSA